MTNELFRRFPDMTPMRGMPTLQTINGIGTSMAGARDRDPETGTYVLSQVFCLLFIPVFWLKSFRVADAGGGGWYFLGRVPTSRRAKAANAVLGGGILATVAAIALTAALYKNPNSPEAVAAAKIAKADAAAAAGQAGVAAFEYRDVAEGGTPRAAEAQRKLADLYDRLPDEATETAGAFDVAAEQHRKKRPIRGDLEAVGKAFVRKRMDADPAGAALVLKFVAPLAADPAALDALRGEVLEKWVAAKPGDLTAAERLAEHRESHGDLAGCEALLAPHEAALGTREGAALLGRVLAGKGELDRAFALLDPYVRANLRAFTDAEAAYRNGLKESHGRIIETLRNGSAKDFDFARYKGAGTSAKEQEKMVDDYVESKLAADPALTTALATMRGKRGAVSAALDLGLVQLQRGRALADPKAREAELKRAEATFLSIRGAVGETDTFKFTLGQVYYWLGKPADGRKLFDELLAAPGSTLDTKLAVVNKLREVGAVGEARRISEGLYDKEPTEKGKQAAANARALLFEDVDDKIAWLKRTDTANTGTRAALAMAMAHKAEAEGRPSDAVAGFREAAAIYDGLAEDAASLNNGALALLGEYEVTGDAKAFARAADKMDRALALSPSDSILLSNAATSLYGGVPREIVGPAVDTRALDRTPSWDMLAYLYADDAGQEAQRARIARHPGSVRAKGYAERLVLLSPKRPLGYALLVAILGNAEDADGMKALAARAAEVEFADDGQAKYLEYAKGKVEDKTRKEHAVALAKAKTAWEAVKGRKDATAAVAAGGYVHEIVRSYRIGGPADPAEAVAVAEAGVAAAASTGGREALREALQFAGHVALAAANPAYMAEAEKTRRTLGHELFDLALAAPGPLGRQARELGKAYLARLAENAKLMPKSPGPVTAYLLRDTHPEIAAAAKADANGLALRRLSGELQRRLSPLDSDAARRQWFDLMFAGKADEAKAVWQPLAAKGVPVPTLPE